MIWHQTDRAYKNAVEQLTRARTSAQLRVAPEDTPPDFSPEPPVKHHEPRVGARIDRQLANAREAARMKKHWTDALKRLEEALAG